MKLKPKTWAEEQMSGADLGDPRRVARATTMLGDLASNSGASLPAACGGEHAELIALYRLLGQKTVSPEALLSAHRRKCAEEIRNLSEVLCVQDGTELDYSGREVVGLGEIGDGRGEGLVQHSALAVRTNGTLIGILRQNLHVKVKPPKGETLRQRQQRWQESDLWADTVKSLKDLDFGSCRVIHVGDRGSDNYQFLTACIKCGHSYVIRAKHDRQAQGTKRLWPWLESQPVAGRYELKLPAGSHRKARVAELTVRFAPVSIPPPVNDPRCKDALPLKMWAVLVSEPHPPRDQEPVEWMLLTDEAISTVADALRVIGYYKQRWKIEEWHRALKEGCGVERHQLKDAGSLSRLAVLLGMVAVRLVQLRDQARNNASPDLPPFFLEVVALLTKRPVAEVTAEACLRCMAHQGGWLGRKNDPPPGWRTLWKGWHKLAAMAHLLSVTKGSTCV